MKTILVPIDFSDNSGNVLAHALGLASIANAEVILFHAFFPVIAPPAAYDAQSVITALEQGKQLELEEFVARAKKEIKQQYGKAPDDVKVTCVATMGGPFEQVLAAIQKYKAGLVVMGMQEGEAVSQAILGSTTISVMLESPVPVLAIPKGVPFRKPTSVVFAAALHKLPAHANLQLLRDFIQLFQAKLQVLHLYRTNAHYDKFNAATSLEVLQRNFEGIDYDFSFDLRHNIAAGIRDYIQEVQAELLVLIPQKHSFVERLLDRSITGQLTAHPLVPLLTLPAASLHTAASVNSAAATV
ncbi:universal stress protein [Pontibacter akesuensis]|uniref:Nucleotide-binding universal stress protein, UspA family n=1 Tax=Pontibacter akesuensis TaxID=388950 RepID=A0A1I7GRI5_9BACT|nr:universal stress protein [Pontibacter akesuensis]GHA55448.1 universal stress protein [Pontibacter akesuensis]SFU51064.1 Nucleotide-binding universal stress protein, UspA family [Pontibacter akesuensis]